MADLRNIASEALFQFDRSRIDFDVNKQFSRLSVDLNAGEILDSFECEVVFQRLELNVVTQAEQVILESFRSGSQFYVRTAKCSLTVLLLLWVDDLGSSGLAPLPVAVTTLTNSNISRSSANRR